MSNQTEQITLLTSDKESLSQQLSEKMTEISDFSAKLDSSKQKETDMVSK